VYIGFRLIKYVDEIYCSPGKMYIIIFWSLPLNDIFFSMEIILA